MIKLFCILDSHVLWRNTIPQAHSCCKKHYSQVIDDYHQQHPLTLLSARCSHSNIGLTTARIKIYERQFALRTCVCVDVSVCLFL